WVNRLKLSFKIEQVCTVPGQKSRCTMGLWRAYTGVHVAEILKAPCALVVELSECRHKAVPFSCRQCVGVLSDAHHHTNRAHQGGGARIRETDERGAGFNLHVSLVAARMTKAAGNKKRYRGAVGWDRKRQIFRERSGLVLAEHDCPPASRRYPCD